MILLNKVWLAKIGRALKNEMLKGNPENVWREKSFERGPLKRILLGR